MYECDVFIDFYASMFAIPNIDLLNQAQNMVLEAAIFRKSLGLPMQNVYVVWVYVY